MCHPFFPTPPNTSTTMLSRLILFATLIAFAKSQFESPPPAAPIQQQEARGPNRYAYSVNILVALNSTMTISTLNQSRAIYWALTSRTNASPQPIKTTTLFNLADPGVRNDPLIRSTYRCAPNESACNSISVAPMSVQMLGDYSYQSFINTLDSLYVDYNVSTWVRPLDMQCALQGGGGGLLQPTTTATASSDQTSSLCAINGSQGVVSVLGSSRVTLTCVVYVAQNDEYTPQADLVIRSVEDNMECADTDSTQVDKRGIFAKKYLLSLSDWVVVVGNYPL